MGDGALLGRETKGEVVLVPPVARRVEAVESHVPPEAVTTQVQELAMFHLPVKRRVSVKLPLR